MGEPECNGVLERFIRTLEEECIHLHDFETLEKAKAVIGAFIERYNTGLASPAPRVLTPPALARSSAEGRPDVSAVHLSRKPGPVHCYIAYRTY